MAVFLENEHAGIKQLPFPFKIASFLGNLNEKALPKPIFQKHCFFKKCPKNLTNFGKFKIFFAFLVAIL